MDLLHKDHRYFFFLYSHAKEFTTALKIQSSSQRGEIVVINLLPTCEYYTHVALTVQHALLLSGVFVLVMRQEYQYFADNILFSVCTSSACCIYQTDFNLSSAIHLEVGISSLLYHKMIPWVYCVLHIVLLFHIRVQYLLLSKQRMF